MFGESAHYICITESKKNVLKVLVFGQPKKSVLKCDKSLQRL